MESRIKYPVGIQTFSEIIEEKYLYVDKTRFIYQLATESKYVFLSRPRRFGKSLLMSTLEEYFKGQKYLFKGLAIDDLESDWIEYPVFRFDLSTVSFTDYRRLIDSVKRILNRIGRLYGVSSQYNNI